MAMRFLLIPALLLAPLLACAAEECKFEAPRNLQVDLAGVRGVQIDLHSQDLHLSGTSGGNALQLTGRACASDKSMLDELQITQRREGDQLILDVADNGHFNISLFGRSYAYLDIKVALPDSLPVTLDVGSGDADVNGLQQLDSHVGSGDLHVGGIRGRFATSVGSGDVQAHDIGSLALGSVGSGDVKASGIHGDAGIGSIGSGDVTLHDVGGSVRADTLGSGDLQVHGVGGDFHLGAKGSGDVGHDGVKGKVSVPSDDD
jgi:hypothetical protein